MKTIIGVVCLALGVVGGIFAGRSLAAKSFDKALEVVRNQHKSDEARLSMAGKRIAKLESQLAEAKASSAAAKKSAQKKEAETPVAVKTDKKEEPIVLGKDMNLEDALKKRLPSEQFTQVTNAFAQFRARLAQRAKSRQDYLSSIDTSGMTAAEKANHKRYLELFAKREAASEKMRGGMFNQDAIREMVEVGMEMRETAKEERATLMRQVARELGYTGDDAKTIQETVQNIYDCTSSGPMSGINDLIESAPMLKGGGAGGASDVKVETHVIGL